MAVCLTAVRRESALSNFAAPAVMGVFLAMCAIGLLGFATFLVLTASAAGSSPFSLVVVVIGSLAVATFFGFGARMAFGSFVRLELDEARVTISWLQRGKVTQTKTLARSDVADVVIVEQTNEVGRNLYSVCLGTPENNVVVSPLPRRIAESCVADADAVARFLGVPRRP